MTGILYEAQHWTNPEIRNYIDALYFTVTALTTTGRCHTARDNRPFDLVVIMILG